MWEAVGPDDLALGAQVEVVVHRLRDDELYRFPVQVRRGGVGWWGRWVGEPALCRGAVRCPCSTIMGRGFGVQAVACH